MRLWILSDLHLDGCCWDLPKQWPAFDVMVVAGDICDCLSDGIDWLSARVKGRPIIYVPGNHEWYTPGEEMTVDQELMRARRLAKDSDIHILLDEEVVIDGVRFLGTTLWTDFELNGTQEESIARAEWGMSDFHVIYPTRPSESLSGKGAVRWHHRSREWLRRKLTEPAPNCAWSRSVVVTHHAPHRRSITPEWQDHPLTPAFCSDLSELVETGGASLWVHGHTHNNFDYLAGGTRVICNPKGYGPRAPGAPIENQDFNPNYTVVI